MSAKQQMKLIADYIMANVPGEPSGDTGGAGDCAVRLLDKYRTALGRIMHETDAHEIAKQALGEEQHERLPMGKALAQTLKFIEMTQALADEHWEQIERDKSRE